MICQGFERSGADQKTLTSEDGGLCTMKQHGTCNLQFILIVSCIHYCWLIDTLINDNLINFKGKNKRTACF